MIAFTRALAKEMAPHGVLINGVAPEDMTSAFVFLASDDGRYYCGQLLHPNSGEIMP